MKTDYNQISKEYQKSKLKPWRQYVEAYTLFGLTADLEQKSVLDLACGDGFYSRQLKLRGAAHVEGVDISEGMIALAKDREQEEQMGIQYHVSDVAQLDLNKQFDMVSASYLLNYARSADEMLQFAQVIAKHLKNGGRFVTVNSNPDFRAEASMLTKYGFTRMSEDYNEGSEITYRFFQDDKTHIDVINYHLEKATHEAVLREAGFENIQWHALSLSPEATTSFDMMYWDNIMKTQPIIGLSCTLKNKGF